MVFLFLGVKVFFTSIYEREYEFESGLLRPCIHLYTDTE